MAEIENQTTEELQPTQTKKPRANSKDKKEVISLDKEQFESDLKTGLVYKDKGASVKAEKKIIKTTKKVYNEAGQLLTKKGKIDKRVETGRALGLKQKRYQTLIEQQKAQKKVILTPIVDDDSEDDLEFEIEVESDLKPAAPVKQSGPDPLILEQIETRKKMDADMIEKLKKENEKLKDSLSFKQQLARIEGKSRVMQCRWE
jgi:hypothetical protein